jgi:GWxTD domain-containing protein
VLKITTTDLYREQSSLEYLKVDKSSKYVRQNFLPIDPETQTPLFRSWFYENEKIHILYNNASTNNLIVKYYDHTFDIAPPPFAVYNHKLFDYETSRTFNTSRTPEGYFEFTASDRGFYHIQEDSTSREGLTLFHYHDGFPRINSPEEMVSALRFITSKKEFTELSESDNQKLELDQFWLKISNNPARARELIKAYYNRVQNANIFFSCHKEGWKTDRGIIYIVFGPPDIVYKSSNAESWVYGEENNYLSVTFNFLKVDNPFTENDYSLKRAPIYKNQWYRAVDSWRQGRVTSLDY